ncbi:MAG: response regulator [bacterium]|nr:response regulator [bacterium]
MTETQANEAPRILMVEDDAGNIQVLGNMLKEKNYKVSVATDGQEALKMLPQCRPDLILLDIMMPKTDGYEVCRQIKASEEFQHIPVIFLTAKAQSEDIVKGFEIGAVDYVTKPFSKAELLARVETQLYVKRAQTELVNMERKLAATAMAITANHEINQPLTVLHGNFEIYKQLLRDEPMTEKKQKCLDKMDKSLERIQAILTKFLKSGATEIDFGRYVGNTEMVVFKES